MDERYLIFIGPDKAGSTWIADRLRDHPSCALAPTKEIFFFDRYHERGLDWYRSVFEVDGSDLLRVDVSHEYLFDEQAIGRIARALPSASLMCCLREPVDRARSALDYMKFQGRVDRRLTLDEALVTVPELLDHARYGTYLSSVLDAVDADQVHIAVFDDLRADPQQFYVDLCEFAGIRPDELTDDQQRARLERRRPLSPRLNRGLRRVAWSMRDLGMQRAVSLAKHERVLALLSRPASNRDSSGHEQPYELIARTCGRRHAELVRDEVEQAAEHCGRDLLALWGYPDRQR